MRSCASRRMLVALVVARASTKEAVMGIVASCDCVSMGVVIVKSAGQKKGPNHMMTNIPFHTRGNGAEFQDQRYGKGRRLHNINRNGTLTCTVCGRRK